MLMNRRVLARGSSVLRCTTCTNTVINEESEDHTTGDGESSYECDQLRSLCAGVPTNAVRRRMPLRRPPKHNSERPYGGGASSRQRCRSSAAVSANGLGAASSTLGGATARLGRRAMRYYRLWIYTCNTALLAGTLAFCGASARTLLFDFRRSLVPAITFYQPSFLYAYFALAAQGGALQLLGCMGAWRLSERLLNAYWLVLLILLFGDLVLGAFWAFKFDRICQDLKPTLRVRFQLEYNKESHFTELWNRLQQEDECCGVVGPMEFVVTRPNSSSSAMLPESCCAERTVNSTDTDCARPHSSGCTEKLLAYLRNTASLLVILGYCVLAFLKVCFLGILRYEIREMIQKIRILRTELELVNVNGAVHSACMAAARAIPGSPPFSGSDLMTTTTSTCEPEREALLVRPDNVALLSSPPMAPTSNVPRYRQGSTTGLPTAAAAAATSTTTASLLSARSSTGAALGMGGSAGGATTSYEMRELKTHHNM